MSIEPSFQVLPVCPMCQEVFPALDTTPALCTKCTQSNGTTPLFGHDENENTHAKERNAKARDPMMRFAFKPVSEQLHDLLQEPGTEDLLDQWCRLPDRHPELRIYQDIFDGYRPVCFSVPMDLCFFAMNLKIMRWAQMESFTLDSHLVLIGSHIIDLSSLPPTHQSPFRYV
ncbi:uncharacterized protein EI90DRAFT_3136055 [Cantharellus anzutake]|uniref:uncharacterized protein n=1 Tax=Cantharellus anzutake TaxID=1750568 RepID=UPI001906CFC1|nr:uncharacterized protein EI90DRAFT_3136055 [Cantharellus anzutake]KAF8314378.1 hypothetical protein EI90DRAFT_3136055 [Cantharellus anzutake]